MTDVTLRDTLLGELRSWRLTLKIYPGFPHGICTTNPDQINADLLAFF